MLPVDVAVEAAPEPDICGKVLDIELPNGVKLRCDADLDSETLVRIVGRLRRLS